MNRLIGRRQFLAGLAGMGLAPLLGGCARQESLLQVGSHVWLGYEPMFLARKQGWLDESRVRLVELPSATDSLQSLHAGRIDAAALTLDETLTARAEGLMLEAILVFNYSTGADVVMVRPEIETPADLAGKTIVVENSAVGALTLMETLKLGSLSPSDVNLRYATHDAHVTVWQDGETDAVVTFEPAATRIQQEGGRRLVDSSAFPDVIVDVLAVRPEAIREKPRALAHLVQAHFDALDFMMEKPEEAAPLLAERLQISAADVNEAYRGITMPGHIENIEALSGQPAPLERTAEMLIPMLIEYGLLPDTVAAEATGLANPDFIATGNR
ncbi:MAG: ABC transporter substrate-binding protein [Halothiobacillaceae bacterium]